MARDPRHLLGGAEFEAFEGLSAPARRDLLKAMGASLGLAGLAGCTPRADERALPYVEAPEFVTPGTAKFYATAVTLNGYAQPVLGKTYAGRPVKLEGLPAHPCSGGATDAFTQAALLGLYDPSRSQAPRFMGRPGAWEAFDTAASANAARLDRTGGEGLRLLTGAQTSPTFARQWAALQTRWPKARWHAFEAAGDDGALQASQLAFGRPLDARLALDQAEAVVAFDADFLDPGPRQTLHAGLWAQRRRAFQNGQGGSRLWMAEPTPSLTGAVADHRLQARHLRIPPLVQALAAALGAGGAGPALTPGERAWIDAAATALRQAGPAGLVVVGARHPAEVQALGFALTVRIGGLGRTLSFAEPAALAPPDGARSLEVLVADMAAGRVDTLAVIEANPVYAAGGPAFAAAMARVRLRLHAGLHYDETARLCHWHAPVQHDLERWSDARSVDGLAAVIQPLIRPFYEVRSPHAILANLQGDLAADGHDLVQATWREAWRDGDDAAFQARWRDTLHSGFVADSAPAAAAAATPVTPSISLPADAGGLSVVFRPDASVWDGRFAANAWLQELPRPLSKLTWGNAVAVSPALARREGLKNGDVVRVAAGGRSLDAPIWITPGQERDTLTLFLGYGRQPADRSGKAQGYDAYPLRGPGAAWALAGVALARTGETAAMATSQLYGDLGEFDFVRSVAPSEAATLRVGPPTAEQAPSFYPKRSDPGPQWGMSIDTDLCIGCNACVTACDAENNIPMVGKTLVAQGREMHWLRIDRYYEGPEDDPAIAFQPVPCMHCEDAPCEAGCPVNATVHSPDGLNLQVYNRCIGTRTCSSYCPYKVRHFNWFDFTSADAPELRAARNPNVTVRSRGVMEKCTYCIQRISAARIKAEEAGRPIAEGEVVTACQQVCPTQAIVFGDVADPASAVSRRKGLKRDYSLLEEVNTRPRTTYLARVDADGARPPHPKAKS